MATHYKYHPVIIALHWCMAVLIFFMLFISHEQLEETPNRIGSENNPEKIDYLFYHMTVALMIAILFIIRLYYRLTKPVAKKISRIYLLVFLGNVVHWTFYLLIIAMLLSGFAIAIQSNLFAIVFFGSDMLLPEMFYGIAGSIIHGIVSIAFMILLLLHICASIFHQLFLKNPVFNRMWFN